MILNLRGTSGSGKSTLVRSVLDNHYPERIELRAPDRQRPFGYACARHWYDPGPALFVPGHYEIACGGCDTIPNLDCTFGLVREAAAMGMDVLFEGLLINSDRKRTIDLHSFAASLGTRLVVLTLATDLDLCVASVNERRRAKRGEEAPEVNPRNTETKHKLALKNHQCFLDSGLDSHLLDRDEAQWAVIDFLNLGQ